MNYNEAYDKLLGYQEDILVLKSKLSDNRKQLEEKNSQLKSFLQIMKKEKKDVEALEGLSISSILSKISGSYDEKIDKESEEYLLAKIRYDEMNTSMMNLKKEMERQHSEIRNLEKEHAELKAHILVSYPEGVALSQEIEAKKKELFYVRKEIVEAIKAVENVTALSLEAESKLSSAKSWSTYDTFFGGGIIGDLVKYSRLDEANQHIAEINSAADIMQKELQDVDLAIENKMEHIGGGERFFDIAFDNIFSDWSIRGKITSNLEHIQNFLSELRSISEHLRGKMIEIDRELSNL
ncbi:hypothetical protein ACHAL6_06485 [Proteiniclasticum sp. C24MP]|uniref:hypothetical protein n=1 Tax=Proteiniclasticum sp. C24MP TaxID=3374101 RepID=UPI003754312F